MGTEKCVVLEGYWKFIITMVIWHLQAHEMISIVAFRFGLQRGLSWVNESNGQDMVFGGPIYVCALRKCVIMYNSFKYR